MEYTGSGFDLENFIEKLKASRKNNQPINFSESDTKILVLKIM